MANRLYQEGASLINYACYEPKVEKRGTQALYLIIFFPDFVSYKQTNEPV